MERKRKLGLAVLGLAILATSTAGAALAQTLVARNGPTGAHQLADSRDFPGVFCRYDARLVLDRVTVESPLVKARDRSAARDRQRVGWRFRVQRDDGSLRAWTTIATSAPQTVEAYEDVRASFTPLSLAVPGSAGRNHRVVVSVFWYRPASTTVEASAAYFVDWYHGGGFEPSFGPAGYCPGAVF